MVYSTALERRHVARHREFESHRLRLNFVRTEGSKAPARFAWGFERRSDVWPAGQTASQGRENSFAPANELFLTESLTLRRKKLPNPKGGKRSEAAYPERNCDAKYTIPKQNKTKDRIKPSLIPLITLGFGPIFDA